MNELLSTEIISEAYSAGYKKCLEDTGILPKFLTQNQTYKKYKRRRVELWVRLKLITPQPDSNNPKGIILYKRERLELLDNVSSIELHYGKIPPENPQPNDRILQPRLQGKKRS